MVQSQMDYATKLYSGTSQVAFSRIKGIMIQAEQEAYNNFTRLSKLLPEQADVFLRLAKMESRHREGFEDCSRHLHVIPDTEFAEQLFSDLRCAFQDAAVKHQVATCLLIQVLGVECFASTLHKNYLSIADEFSHRVTRAIIDDKYSHFNLCEAWLRTHFKVVQDELQVTNRQVLLLIRRMLDRVELDAQAIGISQYSLTEEFIVQYDEALSQIGFNARNILRMLSRK